MKQTFKVAGITVHSGNAKVRFTDDMIRRIKQFSAGGATRIELVDLPSEMTKVEALKYMAGHEKFQSEGDQMTISDSLADREKAAGQGEVKVKAVKAKPSIDAIKARAKKAVTEVAPAAEVVPEYSLS